MSEIGDDLYTGDVAHEEGYFFEVADRKTMLKMATKARGVGHRIVSTMAVVLCRYLIHS